MRPVPDNQEVWTLRSDAAAPATNAAPLSVIVELCERDDEVADDDVGVHFLRHASEEDWIALDSKPLCLVIGSAAAPALGRLGDAGRGSTNCGCTIRARYSIPPEAHQRSRGSLYVGIGVLRLGGAICTDVVVTVFAPSEKPDPGAEGAAEAALAALLASLTVVDEGLFGVP